MNFLKRAFENAVAAIVNGVMQSSVAEVEDGRDTSDRLKTLCRRAAAESCVLLKNEGVLPLGKEEFSVFGRCQFNYFYVGYGSGGDVKAPYKVSPIASLKARGANFNRVVYETYEKWILKNPPYDGFWGFWPTCYDEMKVTRERAFKAAETSRTAIVFLGRSAGEDRENKEKKGSWYLTSAEERMLKTVCETFEKVCVVVNSGSIVDMSWIEKYNVKAVLLAWQGGQESGNGLADVLFGDVSPCGKLPDTVAKIQDYPAYHNFGKRKQNCYCEDVYVGYRYFETFAREKVLYPFGFGLSYTDFHIRCLSAEKQSDTIRIVVSVRNTGKYSGRETVQIYDTIPQGDEGNPAKRLIAFQKTKTLSVGEEQILEITFSVEELACYAERDHAFVLPEGEYAILLGTNARNADNILNFTLSERRIVRKTNSACAPVKPFLRLVNRNGKKEYRPASLRSYELKDRILEHLPESSRQTGDKGYSLRNVKRGKVSLDDFVSQLSEEELEMLCRGSLCGMNAPSAPVGNAGTLGGTSESLKKKGVPVLSANDGPSGVRLQAHTTLIPIGTALAATFDPELVESLMSEIGKEMKDLSSHVFLAPGMNIHRDPLCGRNFEYFSEDPILTAEMAKAYVCGVQSAGVSATVKHFACNNQETARLTMDSVVSERALREIYLKPFERCIRQAKPHCVMASYNKLNGVYNCYNYDLCTTILREEWGFDGVVMTDWWIKKDVSSDFPEVSHQAYRVRAQVDVFMPGTAKSGKYQGKSDGSLLSSLHGKNGITLGELQRSAKNVLRLCMRYIDE